MVNTMGRAKEGRGKSENINKHKLSVPSLINQVINEADIIFEVLDSRFLEKTRNIEIEKRVEELGKLLVYILNKSDLVDVNKIKIEKNFEELKPNLFFSSKKRKGAVTLRKLIKIEAGKIKKNAVNIGIIGYPNTGKSSLINFLVGRNITRTSSEAGFTKGIQKIKISDGIYLIDTPGIIPPKEKIFGNKELFVKHSQIGSITWDRTKNPEMVVFELMKEYPGILENYYGIDAKGDSELLIEKLGRKLCYLRKGNEVDEDRTAKHILRDWQKGKIRLN